MLREAQRRLTTVQSWVPKGRDFQQCWGQSLTTQAEGWRSPRKADPDEKCWVNRQIFISCVPWSICSTFWQIEDGGWTVVQCKHSKPEKSEFKLKFSNGELRVSFTLINSHEIEDWGRQSLRKLREQIQAPRNVCRLPAKQICIWNDLFVFSYLFKVPVQRKQEAKYECWQRQSNLIAFINIKQFHCFLFVCFCSQSLTFKQILFVLVLIIFKAFPQYQIHHFSNAEHSLLRSQQSWGKLLHCLHPASETNTNSWSILSLQFSHHSYHVSEIIDTVRNWTFNNQVDKKPLDSFYAHCRTIVKLKVIYVFVLPQQKIRLDFN